MVYEWMSEVEATHNLFRNTTCIKLALVS